MTIQEMLNRLFQLGLSQADVARECATTQPTISRASKGSTVRYELGKAIELLLADRNSAGCRSVLAPTMNATLGLGAQKGQTVEPSVHPSSASGGAQ